MNRIVISAVVLSTLWLYGCGEASVQALDDYLIETSFSSKSPLEEHTACVLLAQLPFNERMLTDTHSKCALFLRAKWQPSKESIEEFLQYLKKKDTTNNLWKIHSESGYPSSFVPEQLILVDYLALNSNEALEVLITAFKSSDAGHAEALGELIAQHYLKTPARVEKALVEKNINSRDINFIKETAEHVRSSYE